MKVECFVTSISTSIMLLLCHSLQRSEYLVNNKTPFL